MKRLLAPAIGAIALLGFAACSPDSKDFKSEGEEFLEDDDGEIATSAGYTFDDANCEKPDNTDEGTTYACTAVDNEGDTWDFTIEITGERELTVQGVYAPKYLKQALLPQLQGLGTVDEACIDAELAALSSDELRTLTDDATINPTVSDASQAVFDRMATTCVS
jgi:hypothetical protein